MLAYFFCELWHHADSFGFSIDGDLTELVVEVGGEENVKVLPAKSRHQAKEELLLRQLSTGLFERREIVSDPRVVLELWVHRLH